MTIFFAIQVAWSRWWLKRHEQHGPPFGQGCLARQWDGMIRLARSARPGGYSPQAGARPNDEE